MGALLLVLEANWESCPPEFFEYWGDVWLRLLGSKLPIRLPAIQESELSFHLLGNPQNPIVQPGPLICASARKYPEGRRGYFWLSILGLKDGLVADGFALSEDEARLIAENLSRLDMPKFTAVPFLGSNHGLASDYSGEIVSLSPDELVGKDPMKSLPEGDFEPQIRNWMDSACNLLLELPFNQIRDKEGLPVAAMAWPWGYGPMPTVSKASIRRGYPIKAVTNSIMFTGAARMSGDPVETLHKVDGIGKYMKQSAGIDRILYWKFKVTELEQLAQEVGSALNSIGSDFGSETDSASSIVLKGNQGALAWINPTAGKPLGTVAFEEMVHDDGLKQLSWDKLTKLVFNPNLA